MVEGALAPYLTDVGTAIEFGLPIVNGLRISLTDIGGAP